MTRCLCVWGTTDGSAYSLLTLIQTWNAAFWKFQFFRSLKTERLHSHVWHNVEMLKLFYQTKKTRDECACPCIYVYVILLCMAFLQLSGFQLRCHFGSLHSHCKVAKAKASVTWSRSPIGGRPVVESDTFPFHHSCPLQFVVCYHGNELVIPFFLKF